MPKSKNRRKSKQTGETTASAEVSTNVATEDGGTTAEAKPEAKKSSIGPIQFLRQVRDEGQKVTWTSFAETRISTLMVLVMVAIASVFFFLVDQVLRWAVVQILGFSF